MATRRPLAIKVKLRAQDWLDFRSLDPWDWIEITLHQHVESS